MTLPIGGISAVLQLQGGQQFNQGLSTAQRLLQGVGNAGQRAGDLLRRFGDDNASARKSMDDTNGAASRLIGTLKGAAAGYVGANFLKGAIDAASDLDETLNKSQVVFGSHAAGMSKWGDTASTTLRTSKQSAIAAASTFGDMFTQLGLTQGAAADMSKEIVTMSADLGSFHNLGTDEVIDKISASFRGEYDSLQALIPNINAARVEQVALSTTHKQSKDDLTALEKAQAAWTIVTRDGAAAAGDSVRTMDSQAGTAATLQAKYAELQAEIGQRLLPMSVQMMSFMSGTAIPVFGTLAGVVFDNAEALKYAATTVFTLWAAWKVFRIAFIVAALLKLRAALGGSAAMAVVMQAATRTVVLASGATAAAANAAATQINVAGMRAKAGWAALLGGGVIGAVAFGLASLIPMFGDAADETADAAAATDLYTESLDRNSGAITTNTREQIANRLEKSGVLEAARAAGVPLGALTDAILGEASALTVVNQALQDYQTAKTRTTEHGTEVVTEDDVKLIEKITNAIATETSSLSASKAEWQRKAEAVGDATDASDENTKSTDKQKTAVDELSDALDELIGKHLNYAEAEIRSADAGQQFADTVAKAIKDGEKGAKSLDISTEAGRANKEALMGVVSALVAQSEAYAKQTGDTAGATAQLQANIGALEKHAASLGLDASQVHALLASLGALDVAKATPTVTVATTSMFAGLDEAAAAINRAMGWTATPTVGVNISPLREGLQAAAALLNSLPGAISDMLGFGGGSGGVSIPAGGQTYFGGGGNTGSASSGGGGSAGSGASSNPADTKWYRYKGYWYQGRKNYNAAVAADKAKGGNIVKHGTGKNAQYGYGDEAYDTRKEAENARVDAQREAARRKAEKDREAAKKAAEKAKADAKKAADAARAKLADQANNAADAVQGFVGSLSGSAKDVGYAQADLVAAIGGKNSKAAKAIADETAALNKAIADRDKTAAALVKAQDKLAKASELTNAIKSGFQGAFNVTSSSGWNGAGSTAASLLADVTQKANMANNAKSKIGTLAKMNVGKEGSAADDAWESLVQQLASEGVGAYGQINALAGADSGTIAKIAQQYASLGASGQSAGDIVSQMLYGTTVSQASKDAQALQTAADKLADKIPALAKALVTELAKNMPSPVMEVDGKLLTKTINGINIQLGRGL